MSSSFFPCLVTILLSVIVSVHAFWRLPCSNPVTVQRVDPIVNPGVLGTHVHTVSGSASFSASSTNADLANSNLCSTCIVQQDNSAYWTPNLYYKQKDGQFQNIGGGGLLVYYLQRNSTASQQLTAFPPGFRMISGTPTRRTYNASNQEDNAITFACLGYNGPETHSFPNTDCPSNLRMQVFFPSCWDGVNVDSPDHKSHVAYLSGINTGTCPPTHPVQLISIFFEVSYAITAYRSGWIDSASGLPYRDWPFYLSTNDNVGYTFHGDFMNGWNVGALQQAVNECQAPSGVIEECPVFQFRSSTSNCTLSTPPLSNEQVFGSLWNLPNFPLSSPSSSSTRPSSLSVHLGCFNDNVNQQRTLPVRLIANDANLTPQRCIAAALAANVTYAGMEYGIECWGGMSAPSSSFTNTIGSCNTLCPGTLTDVWMCGGSNALSVWQVNDGVFLTATPQQSFNSSFPKPSSPSSPPSSSSSSSSSPSSTVLIVVIVVVVSVLIIGAIALTFYLRKNDAFTGDSQMLPVKS